MIAVALVAPLTMLPPCSAVHLYSRLLGLLGMAFREILGVKQLRGTGANMLVRSSGPSDTTKPVFVVQVWVVL